MTVEGPSLLYSSPQRTVATMAAHLSDRTKKKIIADRVDGMSLRRIAEKYGCSVYAVSKACESDQKFKQKITQKKEQNTLDMLAYLNARTKNAQEFIDIALEAIKDPEKIDKASVQTLATAVGIIIDKFTQTNKKNDDEGVTIIWGR